MVDVLTPVLSDNWDAERSWTLESYEAGRRLRRPRRRVSWSSLRNPRRNFNHVSISA